MVTQSNHWLIIAVVAMVWIALLIGLGLYFDHDVSATARSRYTNPLPETQVTTPSWSRVHGLGVTN